MGKGERKSAKAGRKRRVARDSVSGYIVGEDAIRSGRSKLKPSMDSGIGRPLASREVHPVPTDGRARHALQLIGWQLTEQILGVPQAKLEFDFVRDDKTVVDRLIALDRTLMHITDAMDERLVPTWLGSFNAHLGARPIDLLRAGEDEQVMRAADAYAAGSYG